MMMKTNSHTLQVEMQNDTASWEDCKFVIKLNTPVPYDTSIRLLGACTWVFIGALLITAEIWKQPRVCPLLKKANG